MGAVSNRLSSTMSNLDQIAVNLSASQGRIQDADFAQETGNLAKNQILQQAATAMIAQANDKSSVLTLVRLISLNLAFFSARRKHFPQKPFRIRKEGFLFSFSNEK